MSEQWISTGRAFCEICKVWFGNNRASVEFHERGQKHKNAVAQKLRDLGKGNAEKAKKQGELNAMLAQMEQGAHESMKTNNEGVMNGPALPERGLGIGPKVPVGGTKYLDPRQMSMQAMAMEMDRRKQEEEEKKAKLAEIMATSKSSLWREEEEEQTPLPSSDASEILWVEAVADDGTRYYYHMFSGATAWEAPDRFYTQKEYDRRLADIEKAALERQKKGLPADPSQLTTKNTLGEDVVIAPAIQVAKRKKARDEDEIAATVRAAKAAKEGYGSGGQTLHNYADVPSSSTSAANAPPLQPAQDAPRFTAMPERSGPSVFGNRSDRRKEKRSGFDNSGGRSGYSSHQPRDAPSATDDFSSIPMPEDIPLPPPPAATSSTQFSESSGATYRTAPAPPPPRRPQPQQHRAKVSAEEGTAALAPSPFVKEEEEKEFKEEVEEAVDESESKDVGEDVRKIAATATPFGAWTTVKKDPLAQQYVKPLSEEERKKEARTRAWKERENDDFNKAKKEKEVPKIEFTEKVAPTLTKKKNVGPVEFKKKSAPKSVRRRDEEE